MTSLVGAAATEPTALAERLASLPWIAGVAIAGVLGPLAFFAPGPDGRPQLVRARMRVMRRIA